MPAGAGASSVFGIVLQDRCVVLAAVENANDGYLLGVHVESDHGALLVGPVGAKLQFEAT